MRHTQKPRPPAPHTLSSTSAQSECLEHYLGQIYISIKHLIVNHTLLFSALQLSPAHSPAFTSSKWFWNRFQEFLQGFCLETLAAPLSHEHLKAGIQHETEGELVLGSEEIKNEK